MLIGYFCRIFKIYLYYCGLLLFVYRTYLSVEAFQGSKQFRFKFLINVKFFFVTIIFVFSAHSADISTLKILSLLEEKNYAAAVILLEAEIKKLKDNSKKGYYAFLLNQFPVNIEMKRPRHEYAFIAARWAQNIPDKERTALWIEAGDGFFKLGSLKRAYQCYKTALSYIKQGQFEFVYILHKQAWIYINQKKWIRAFNILNQALHLQQNKLKNIILSDIGKIWVESQHFRNRIPFKYLKKNIHKVSYEDQQLIIDGIIQGMSRVEKQSIKHVVSTLSSDQKLSTRILDYILSNKKTLVIQPCHLLFWLGKVRIQELKKDEVFSVLNLCTRESLSVEKKNELNRRQLKQIARFYKLFEREGIERWPLVLIYKNIGWKNSACNESLRQLIEIVNLMDKNLESKKMEITVVETFHNCKKAKGKSHLVAKTVNTLLSSDQIAHKYRMFDNSWENALFNLLNLQLFYYSVRQNILKKASEKWRGKDLLPNLLLSDINSYNSKEINYFFNRFGVKPVKSYYLDILAVRENVFMVKDLERWLPLSEVDSYRGTLPWIKKALSGELKLSQKENVVKKLLRFFPLQKVDKNEVAVFLALYYLKTSQTANIFKYWEMIYHAFDKEILAVELFEKSLYEANKNCRELKSSVIFSRISSNPLLQFINQCCQIVESKINTVVVDDLKIPSLLKSSTLAGDFKFLVHIQKKTLWMETGISQLQTKTSKMIMDLKKSISYYQNRKWHLQILAERVKFLLRKQVNLFEIELTKLSHSSPYGVKYKELRKIVVQWK